MRNTGTLVLTEAGTVGLFFIQRYRFLTILQFSRASGLSRFRAKDLLRSLELRGIVGHFGNVLIAGHGKTPKVYYLKRRGWEMLRRESDIPEDLIGSFVESARETSWSPQMYHRLRLLDLMITLEIEVRKRPHLNLVRTFLEYRRYKKDGRIRRETTDYVAEDETTENRIIPDAAFVLENTITKRRGLFFIEMDMATERIVTKISNDKQTTLKHKFEQYDKYLISQRFTETYKSYGELRHFTTLFVTYGKERIDNIRQSVSDLPAKLHSYYRLTTYEQAMDNFLGMVWKSRALSDTNVYPLVRER